MDEEKATERRERKLVKNDFSSWARSCGKVVCSTNTGGRNVAREGRVSGNASV